MDNLDRTWRTGESFVIEVEIRGAQSGRVKFAELRGYPHINARGEIDYLLAILQETIERKQSQVFSAELIRDFSAFLESTTDFVTFKDKNGRFRFCSQSLARMTGYAH